MYTSLPESYDRKFLHYCSFDHFFHQKILLEKKYEKFKGVNVVLFPFLLYLLIFITL